MKFAKRFFALLLAFVMVLGLAACGSSDKKGDKASSEADKANSQASKEDSKEASGDKKEDATKGKTELGENSLFLITDLGTIDDKSFNQNSFEGLKKFGKEIGVEAKYLKPAGEGDQNYEQAIEQAIKRGAKIVVTPGFLFELAVGNAQKKHPDVKFIAVDFEPKTVVEGKMDDKGNPVKEKDIQKNTVSVLFKEQESGFLAGYAAVKDGYKNLGFMGGVAVPAVIRYGFGFIAGANYAAEQLNEKVNINYNYTGKFTASPEIQTMAATWYKKGTEMIFGCGGGIYASILKAAQENNKFMIGVDGDQGDLGKEIVTSAMKNLSTAVYDVCKSINDGSFKGGDSLIFTIKEKGLQLSDDFSRFKTFKEDDYKKIYQDMIDNKDGITKKIPDINFSLPEAEQGDPSKIMEQFKSVTLNYIQ